MIAGHAVVQNLRRGHCELGADARPALPVAAAFTELAHAHLTNLSGWLGASAGPATQWSRSESICRMSA